MRTPEPIGPAVPGDGLIALLVRLTRTPPGLSSVAADPASVGAVRRAAPPRLSVDQYRVLQAVADGRITRGYLLGDFEPYLLDDREVIRVLRGLVLRRLVLLRPIGPPCLTARGRWVLDAPD